MTLDRTLLVPLHLDMTELLSGAQVAHFKPQQAIDVYKTERVASSHGVGTDDIREWSNRAHDLMTLGVGDRKEIRLQAGQIDMFAIERVDRIVRTRIGLNGCDHGAGRRVDHVPRGAFEFRNVKYLAIRGNRQAVAATFVSDIP